MPERIRSWTINLCECGESECDIRWHDPVEEIRVHETEPVVEQVEEAFRATRRGYGLRERRYTIAVDFDGVIHRYDTPWVAAHVIPDPPVEGAIEWLNEMAQRFEVVIFTTRGKTEEGRAAVARWLGEHGLDAPPDDITAVKPPALVYIDDRAWRFDGAHFPTAQEIHQARPWHKARPMPSEREQDG